jgi:hypothetical protein
MAATGAYATDVVARLGDYFAPHAHWQRRLWNVGLLLGLRETIEASDAVRARALSQEALGWLADRVRNNVAQDPGAGDQTQRTALMECLKRDLSADGLNYLMLQHFADDVEKNYLPRWADELRTATQPRGRERTARALAAHLLDSGIGPTELTRWVDDSVSSAAGALDVADLFDAGAQLLNAPQSLYEILVLFEVAPSPKATRPTEWISSDAAAAWLRTKGFAGVKVRQRGGLLLEVKARDEAGAISLVADTIDRFTARVVVGTSSSFEIHPTVYVGGGSTGDRSRPRRNVKVHALTRADRVYDLQQVGPIDSALELLAHLDTAAPPVAVAAGWSAIESLLLGPGDKSNVAAADRLAGLVACSWGRAELTDLAWAKASQRDEALCDELLALSTNREKAGRIALELAQGTPLSLTSPSDAAAVRRIEKLLAEPRRVLNDVRLHASESFRRLYRVRNMILHAGQTSPVSLSATLRTAPPLVGAGMDRVTHSYLVSGRLPLEIAARAELEVSRAGSAGAPPLTDLLE